MEIGHTIVCAYVSLCGLFEQRQHRCKCIFMSKLNVAYIAIKTVCNSCLDVSLCDDWHRGCDLAAVGFFFAVSLHRWKSRRENDTGYFRHNTDLVYCQIHENNIFQFKNIRCLRKKLHILSWDIIIIIVCLSVKHSLKRVEVVIDQRFSCNLYSDLLGEGHCWLTSKIKKNSICGK